jgi:hypothetical protein
MISHQRAFRPLVKCLNPLPFPPVSAIIVSNHQLRFTASAVPSIRNVSSNAPNTSDTGTKSNTTPRPKHLGIESESLVLGTKLIGKSGMQYRIDRMLQHRTDPVLACVYLAMCEHPENIMIYCANLMWSTVLGIKICHQEHLSHRV